MKQLKIRNCDVLIFESHEAAAAAVAEEILNSAERALEQFGKSCLSLAGGRTILRAEELLAQHPRARAIEWGHVDLFFTDEHIVPIDSPENNYGLARPFLEPLIAQGLRVHPIRTTQRDTVLSWEEAQAEARRYEREIKQILGPQRRFDLVVLGLGADRHIASLLPERGCFANLGLISKQWVEAIEYPKDLYPGIGLRISLTPRVFAQSERVVLFVTGAQKQEALKKALWGPQDVRINPGGLIQRLLNAKVITDVAAGAALLEKGSE